MIKLLDLDQPEDIVISTGVTNSVRDLCRVVFSKIGLDYKDFVKINKKYIRPQELPFLCGDSSKAKKILNWKPDYDFDKLITEMINSFDKSL